MSSEKLNVPQRRFKEFENAGAWEQREISDFGEIITGSTPQTSDGENYGSDFLFVSPADIQENRYVEKTKTMLSQKGYDKCRSLKEGSILFVSIGSTIGKIGQLKSVGATNQQINSIITNEKYNSDFVFSLLLNHSKGIKELASSQAVPIINKTTFSDIEVPITTIIDEQTKIGTFFKTLDNLITCHQRKLEKLQAMKSAYLSEMFPTEGENKPKRRFSGFTDDWEQRELGQFGKSTGGTSIESEFSEDGEYKVISIGSYSENSKYNDQGIRAGKTNKTEPRILNKDDLTMILNDKTSSGNIIGRVLLIDADDTYVYNQRTERIEVDKNSFEPKFLYQLLNADTMRSKIIKSAQGNTQIYVNWSAVSELTYYVPRTKDEQKEIASYLDTFDNLITCHQRKVEKLKNMKQAYLTEMFV